MKTLHVQSKIKINSKEDGFKFIASTEAVDRHGEVIKQNGWDITRYMENPVILWGHEYDELPVGKATNIYVENNQLVVEGVWASEKANPDAECIRNLYLEGMINAVSVGFIAKEWEGNVITKAELLEISIVTVPANQEALSLLKSKGLSAGLLKNIEVKETVEETVEIVDEEKEEVKEDAPVVEEEVKEEVEEEKSIEDETIDETLEGDEDTLEIEDEESEEITVTDDEGADDTEEDADELDTNDEILDNDEKGIKAGRTLSEATRKQIISAIEQMSTTISILETLLAESDTPKGIDNSFITLEKGKILVDEKQMQELLAELRGNDRRNEAAISTVKTLLGK